MNNTSFSYPTKLTLSYANDYEYRTSIRQLFQMNADRYPDVVHSDIDEVSRDELEYDEASADLAMQYIMNNTHDKPLFRSVYEQAASFMFSTDINIGLAVLFSYDYLLLFHECLCEYFSSLVDNERPFTGNNEKYQALYNRIFKKR